MSKKYPLLENAPDHSRPEFIDYLRENNVVVWETDVWIVIENCKYHTKEKPWYTAFWKPVAQHSAMNALHWLSFAFMDWEWLKKAEEKQTVKRFHIHFYKP